MATTNLELTVGGIKLDVRQFDFRERMSHPYEVRVIALSRDTSITFDKVVGTDAEFTVHYEAAGQLKHTWAGLCRRFELVAVDAEAEVGTYEVWVVPHLCQLGYRTNQRIFQEKNVEDIVTQILGEYGVKHSWKLAGTYDKYHYRVQYNESDFDFVSRLLEDAGISYYFEGDKSDQLLLSDRAEANPPRGEELVFTGQITRDFHSSWVSRLHVGQEWRSGKQWIRDHDFKKEPKYELKADESGSKLLPKEQQFELYDYRPGSFFVDAGKGDRNASEGVGQTLAKDSLASARSGNLTVVFETSAVDLAPGVVCQISGHPHADAAGKPLLMIELTGSGERNEDWTFYGTAVHADKPHRPVIKTAKPNIEGMQSAVVVGPPGEEIYTDEFGRCKVQFHWDREGSYDDTSSCWLRVSQGWADTGFGHVNLPRVGQEVLVAFVQGDPDRPMVVGRVFNSTATTPYKLPDHKTKSVWRTNSSPGGGGYNEIVLEDKKGEEQVYIQAERQLDKLVKKDEIVHTQGKYMSLVEKTVDEVVMKTKKERIDEDYHLVVKGAHNTHVMGDSSSTNDMNRYEKTTMNHAMEASMNMHLKAGMNAVIEAGLQLTLKAGGGFITIDPAGVTISGIMVKINSGGSAGTGCGCEAAAAEEAEDAVITEPITIKG